MSAMMGSLHLLAPLVLGAASPSASIGFSAGASPSVDDRSLFLLVLGWLLDLDPKATLLPGSDSSQAAVPFPPSAPLTGGAFVVEAYITCLRLPGREALQLRTQALQLLPSILLGLTSPAAAGPVGARTPGRDALLLRVTDAVQWMADEYWASDSLALPKHGSEAAALRVQLGAVLEAVEGLCRLRGGHGSGSGSGSTWDPFLPALEPQGSQGGAPGPLGQALSVTASPACATVRAVFDALLPVFQQVSQHCVRPCRSGIKA